MERRDGASRRCPPNCTKKSLSQSRKGFSLSKKQYSIFMLRASRYARSIEFALQIHKFREHVSRNFYKGRKNVSAGRGFSSRFARKRRFEREAVRKTKFFDSLNPFLSRERDFLFYFVRYSSINSHASSMQPGQERRTLPSATPLRSRHRYAPFFCSNFSLSIFVTL